MKTLAAVAVAVALALAASVHVASAYVAVVGTAVSVPSAPDAERSARLEQAIWAAIRDVLEHAVSFTPTVVTIEDVRIVGDRVHLLIFLSDEGGESVAHPPGPGEGLGNKHNDEGGTRPNDEAGQGPAAEMPKEKTWL